MKSVYVHVCVCECTSTLTHTYAHMHRQLMHFLCYIVVDPSADLNYNCGHYSVGRKVFGQKGDLEVCKIAERLCILKDIQVLS